MNVGELITELSRFPLETDTGIAFINCCANKGIRTTSDDIGKITCSIYRGVNTVYVVAEDILLYSNDGYGHDYEKDI